ncbi:hypothetical protein [Aquibacillus rhizosphaerae]|uniref:Uncharacterized protein n=1 Tax=Aquibacillus rhizosphaerae TaxID=3051431 RepID=A0ABT7L9D0_9BACI|nr:hypothetical protein [Aquibacillus sp. LR5S19]MDL4842475.1 hypothetical protein [Aquibacillus sp. LR5S19]
MKKIKHSDLKQYKAFHIFEYYDFPLFFISQSPSNELFLNYYIEDIDVNLDKWLFARITGKELKGLIDQRLSVLSLLNHLYSKKRLFHLFLSSIPTSKKAEFELVEEYNFDEESFPEEDFFVEYDYVTKQKFIPVEEDLIDSSRFKMVLRDTSNSHDISLNLLLDVLGNLKKSINDMAYDIGSKLLGQRPDHEINLRVDSFQPSSFGVYLMTDSLEEDLFELPEKSLNNLFELIDDIQHKSPVEIEEQVDIDEEYSVETIKSVKKLLKDIVENDFSLAFEAQTKTKMALREVKFDKDSYGKLEILEKILKDKSEKYSKEVEVEGVLTSINTTNNRFRITTTSIGEIGGRMSTKMFKDLKKNNNLQFKVPSKIKATIQIEFVNDYVEENHFEKYTLVDFEQPE